tara:strand:+ start:239 stop:763 length:525 start_codon:yes stop_codon:yes gene_type:complete
MKIERSWSMPNKNTFDIKPIRNLIKKYNRLDIVSVDPFANKNKIAKITNDIDNTFDTTFNLDALDFLKKMKDNSVDLLYFDPPYSPRQVAEVYKKMGKSVNFETTQSSFWSKMKDEIFRITKFDSIVISFGWNSNGIGKKRDFEILEILIVAHGGQHNDTICVVEKKKKNLFDE